MKKKIVIFLSYIILFFNSNLLSDENNKKLKIGLLAPLTGEYADLGKHLGAVGEVSHRTDQQ